jgi:hypothetical protein
MQRCQYGEAAIEGNGDSDDKKLVIGLLGNVKKPTKGEMYGI